MRKPLALALGISAWFAAAALPPASATVVPAPDDEPARRLLKIVTEPETPCEHGQLATDRGCIAEPERWRYREPEFPKAALRAGIERARVVVHGIVDRHGRVTEAKVIESSHPGYGFERAALEAVWRWRYMPILIDGKRWSLERTFEIPFERPAAAD